MCWLTRAGYPVCRIASRGDEAVAMTLKCDSQVILLDIHLTGLVDGFETVRQIRTMWDSAIIFVSEHMNEVKAAQAAQFSPLACLSKPITFNSLRTVLETIPPLTSVMA